MEQSELERFVREHSHTGQDSKRVDPVDLEGVCMSEPTSATTGTMSVNMAPDIITITPTGDCTFNAEGGYIGKIVTFYITTSGATSRTLTFGTNFRNTGTLATGTTTARYFTVTFRCIDGQTWAEIARTGAQS